VDCGAKILWDTDPTHPTALPLNDANLIECQVYRLEVTGAYLVRFCRCANK
jgi:hypothetical protein